MDTAPGVVRRDGRTDAFFDGAAADRLMIRRCTACDHWYPPDASDCAACGGTDLAWARAEGRATLVTWAVSHPRPRDRDPGDGEAAGSPTLLALVELAEGPWLHTRLDGIAPGTTPAEGLPLVAAFEHPEEGEPHLVFRPTP